MEKKIHLIIMLHQQLKLHMDSAQPPQMKSAGLKVQEAQESALDTMAMVGQGQTVQVNWSLKGCTMSF